MGIPRVDSYTTKSHDANFTLILEMFIEKRKSVVEDVYMISREQDNQDLDRPQLGDNQILGIVHGKGNLALGQPSSSGKVSDHSLDSMLRANKDWN